MHSVYARFFDTQEAKIKPFIKQHFTKVMYSKKKTIAP